MESSEVVAADVPSDGLAQGAIVEENASMDGFGLHRVEERLDKRIVAKLPRPLHALHDRKRRQTGPVRICGELYSPVRVKDQAAAPPAPRHGSIQRLERQRQVPSRPQRPPQNPPRVSV